MSQRQTHYLQKTLYLSRMITELENRIEATKELPDSYSDMRLIKLKHG